MTNTQRFDAFHFRLYWPAPSGKPQPHREGGESAPLLPTFQGVLRLQRSYRTKQQKPCDLLVEIRRENCPGKCTFSFYISRVYGIIVYEDIKIITCVFCFCSRSLQTNLKTTDTAPVFRGRRKRYFWVLFAWHWHAPMTLSTQQKWWWAYWM